MSLSFGPGERVALIGENGAGKSSLMNVLYGLYQPDAGALHIDGMRVTFRGPHDAMAAGIGMVHQHFMLVPELTVAENIVLGQEPRRLGLLDLRRAHEEVDATCRKLGFTLDPRAKVRNLSVGSQQKVEIVRALHRGVRLLILDEPTAVLTAAEVQDLFRVIHALSQEGCTVVFIGHKLGEVLAFADRIAVMRRGALVGDVKADETNPGELAAWMLGEPVTDEALSAPAAATRMGVSLPSAGTSGPSGTAPAPAAATAFPPHPAAESSKGEACVPHDGCAPEAALRAAAPPERVRRAEVPPSRDTVVRVRGLETRPSAGHLPLRGVNLELRAGEILGIAGVDGNGQRELALVLTGLLPYASGEIVVGGKPLPRGADARLLRRMGLAHLPEDRLHTGIIGTMTAAENLALTQRPGAPRKSSDARALLEAHDVRPPDPSLPAGRLSGGNQQKLVVARELSLEPRWLVAVQPVRGLDLRASASVHAALRAARDRKVAVLLLSLDLSELLALSDRIHVISRGRLGPVIERPGFDAEEIGRRMVDTHAEVQS